MQVVFFDFDGTMINKNSFPVIVKQYFFYLLKNLNLITLLQLIVLLFRRKIFKNISHSDFKRKILQSSNSTPFKDFSPSMPKSNWNNGVLKNYLSLIKRDDVVVYISTAAPSCWVASIFEEANIPKASILGSHINNGVWFDNFGISKVVSAAGEGIADIDILFTDSLDDAPLMMISSQVNLVFNGYQNSQALCRFIEFQAQHLKPEFVKF